MKNTNHLPRLAAAMLVIAMAFSLTANGGLPPMTKRKRYYDSLKQVA